MIGLQIPGFGDIDLKHLVLDYNGTLALDGTLMLGAGEALRLLAGKMEIHVITADTFALARKHLSGLPLSLTILPETSQAEAKLEYIRQLGAQSVVAIGNGRNDREMLRAAAIGIFLFQKEGGSVDALKSADIISVNLLDALGLLSHPQRLVATLRS
ncbi:MAG: hypothetical protein Q8Q59_08245 [Luteolibacter sp.]|jgi:soluble P-type ATPase|nr:hypothetical protein [Luteolibacter sp.]